MSRRSRSQRPQKARHSEAPPAYVQTAAKAAEPVEERPREAAATPIDELAAVDAGWDDLLG
jgi:hypothetical protein